MGIKRLYATVWEGVLTTQKIEVGEEKEAGLV
jgi:adenylosuccinate synthase